MLYFYLFLSIGASFLCSLFEAVILSISPAFISAESKKGKKSALLLQKLKQNIDGSLSAILTLNTIAHTIGAAGVGAEVQKIYGNEYVAFASAILTLLILVLSEVIPKTIGATYFKQLSTFTAYGIQYLIYLTYPFVRIFESFARLINPDKQEAKISRDEVLNSAELSDDLSNEEVLIIKNLLRFRKILVRDVMTPRTVVFALEESQTIAEASSKHSPIPFSRIPIYKQNIDNVTGVVNRYDLTLNQLNTKLDTKLTEIARPINSIADTKSIGEALNLFIKQNQQIFTVHDEHGGLDGVITFEDVIETLLGIEITDEFDSVEDMRAFAFEKWQQRRKARAEVK